MNIVIGFSIGAVTLVLFLGLFNMMKGGSPSRAQHLMRLRVLLQFFAIIIMMGVLWYRNA